MCGAYSWIHVCKTPEGIFIINVDINHDFELKLVQWISTKEVKKNVIEFQ
jgi:hypothetical protein